MKKFTTTVSPFIFILFPVFLMMGFVFFNSSHEIPAEKQEVSIHFQAPAFKNIVKAIF